MSDDKFDINSIDAMHWAIHCIRISRHNAIPMDNEEWLMGWFANYWAAVNDPLQYQIDNLNKENEKYKEALIKLSCLGNGDKPGNSIGNTIAQEALKNESA